MSVLGLFRLVLLLLAVQLAGCAQSPYGTRGGEGAEVRLAPVTDATKDDPMRDGPGRLTSDDLTRIQAGASQTEAAVAPGNPIASPPPFAGRDEVRPAANPGSAPNTVLASAAPATGPRSRASRALLQQAQAQAESGQAERAAATIERALKIEPRNPVLWNRLAQLRFATQSLDQAIECANRSNNLAGNDSGLKASNWELIARVYERRGAVDQAQQARVEAQRLRG